MAEEWEEETTMSDTQVQTFKANIRLAHWVAHRYGHGILPMLDDRIQAARIGLWKAVLHHDPTKAKLTTFAVRVMINEILHAGIDERRPAGTVCIEDVQAVLAEHRDNPEALLLRHEENAALSTFAAKVQRKRGRKGATWTATDVAAEIDKGHRPAEVARMFGVSRERIRQIIVAIRAERAKEGGG